MAGQGRDGRRPAHGPAADRPAARFLPAGGCALCRRPVRARRGRPPEPFTVITEDMLADGTLPPSPGVLALLPSNVAAEGWVERQLLHYVRSLARQGRNVLIVWPDHCLIG